MSSPEQIECTVEHEGVSVSFVLPSESDHISQVLRSTGTFYEREMLVSLASHLQAGDLVVDAGANIGNHALFFAKVCGCRVLAFEAMPDTSEVLKKNVAINHAAELVEVHQVALGAEAAHAAVLRYDPTNVGGTTLSLDEAGSIDVQPLDELVNQSPVRLIKIDVEGMDLDVLKGARRILSDDRPWVVCEAGTAEAYATIREFMRESGYLSVGVYNATDTYLFLPSRSPAERELLIERGLQQLMSLQREDRQLAARLAQAGRHTERVRANALAQVDQRLAAWSSTGEGVDAVNAATFKRAMAAKDKQIAELSGAMERERSFADRGIADAQARMAASRSDAAGAARRLAEATTHLAEEKARAQALHATQERLLAELDGEVARGRDLQREVAQLRSQLAEAEKSNDLATRRESILQGLVVRHERELERQGRDKDRRISGAHRALAECRRAAREQLQRVEHSASYRLGTLVVGSLRSPGRMVALAWRVPMLLWREWRVRAGQA
ncbi:FkbM family methyltransferase [Lysobacter sp. F6437]|uniref:FkbM family methyltransferase n=1 Tax=Lysobacter sp. F6437 TaxID=3459296 RepID=UPI00403D7D54